MDEMRKQQGGEGSTPIGLFFSFVVAVSLGSHAITNYPDELRDVADFVSTSYKSAVKMLHEPSAPKP